MSKPILSDAVTTLFWSEINDAPMPPTLATVTATLADQVDLVVRQLAGGESVDADAVRDDVAALVERYGSGKLLVDLVDD